MTVNVTELIFPTPTETKPVQALSWMSSTPNH